MRMPFGISSRPEEFQWRLPETLDGLIGISTVADDILIVGRGQTGENMSYHFGNERNEGTDLAQSRGSSGNRYLSMWNIGCGRRQSEIWAHHAVPATLHKMPTENAVFVHTVLYSMCWQPRTAFAKIATHYERSSCFHYPCGQKSLQEVTRENIPRDSSRSNMTISLQWFSMLTFVLWLHDPGKYNEVCNRDVWTINRVTHQVIWC